MKVIIDIDHPAAINFYKNAINILAEKGTEVEIAVRPRGNILSILQKELPGFHFEIIGKYYSSISGKIIGYIERELGLIHYLSKTNFDISTGFGSEICYASRILGKPSVIFEDDYEYKLTFYLSKFAATRFIMPDYIPASGRNIYKYRGLKELAYLHPKYFKPNKKILDQYKLKPNEYVFIREIANTSLNYRKISSRLYEIIRYLEEIGFQSIVSIEDESLIRRFKKNCIVLEEPVEDIYSLLSFAALTISSGDTMARESCLVGTPTIYTGGRNMSVNKELIKRKCMFKVDNMEELRNIIKYINENNLKDDVKEIVDYYIKYEWDDVTKIIVENLLDVLGD